MNLIAPRSPTHGLLQLDTLCRALLPSRMLLLPSRKLLLPSRLQLQLQLTAPALSDVVASQFMKLATLSLTTTISKGFRSTYPQRRCRFTIHDTSIVFQRRCRSHQYFRSDLLVDRHCSSRVIIELIVSISRFPFNTLVCLSRGILQAPNGLPRPR